MPFIAIAVTVESVLLTVPAGGVLPNAIIDENDEAIIDENNQQIIDET